MIDKVYMHLDLWKLTEPLIQRFLKGLETEKESV